MIYRIHLWYVALYMEHPRYVGTSSIPRSGRWAQIGPTTTLLPTCPNRPKHWVKVRCVSVSSSVGLIPWRSILFNSNIYRYFLKIGNVLLCLHLIYISSFCLMTKMFYDFVYPFKYFHLQMYMFFLFF